MSGRRAGSTLPNTSPTQYSRFHADSVLLRHSPPAYLPRPRPSQDMIAHIRHGLSSVHTVDSYVARRLMLPGSSQHYPIRRAPETRGKLVRVSYGARRLMAPSSATLAVRRARKTRGKLVCIRPTGFIVNVGVPLLRTPHLNTFIMYLLSVLQFDCM